MNQIDIRIEKRLLDNLEKECRKLARAATTIPGFTRGGNTFPDVTPFREIASILRQLDLLRNRPMVPTQRGKET